MSDARPSLNEHLRECVALMRESDLTLLSVSTPDGLRIDLRRAPGVFPVASAAEEDDAGGVPALSCPECHVAFDDGPRRPHRTIEWLCTPCGERHLGRQAGVA